MMMKNKPMLSDANTDIILGSVIVSLTPLSPPTSARMIGRSKKENTIVRKPWMKSVMMAAPRPPAAP